MVSSRLTRRKASCRANCKAVAKEQKSVNESYKQHFAALYDRLMADMPYDEWQRFVREAWGRYGLAPQTVVDLGCGTGRITTALAQEGLRVVGIDLSEHMLAVAQERSDQAAPNIQAAGGS